MQLQRCMRQHPLVLHYRRRSLWTTSLLHPRLGYGTFGKTEPIKIGKASPTEGALPASLYFALKYKDNVEEALIANAGCGGDSAARGMVIGMLLGAQKSFRGVVETRNHRWMVGLNAYDRVMTLIDSNSKNESLRWKRSCSIRLAQL